MRGSIFRLYNAGVRLEREEVLATGDFNFMVGAPNTGRAENEATVSVPGKGTKAILHDARVVAVAGFGMRIAGLESVLVKRDWVNVQQEWWFVPTGHEEP